MNAYEAKPQMCDEGLIRYDMDQDQSTKLLEDVGDESKRMDALNWVRAKGYPVLLNVANQAPQSFVDLLTIIPHRDKIHTKGQPVALAHRFDVQAGIRNRLAEPGNKLAERYDAAEIYNIAALVRHHRTCVEATIPAAAIDISTLNLITSAQSSYDMTRIASANLVEEMNYITSKVRHFKHVWDETSRGQVLISPEEDILHRRMGHDTGQVVWHVDTVKGFIFFCLLNDQQYPHRVVFEEDGKIDGKK